MVKRINNIYKLIYSKNNIELADTKARRCKKNRYGIKKHDKNREQDNLALLKSLKNGEYLTSTYDTYKIYEPKERLIFRLPYYPDRITHHAIMNVMENIWTKIFTRDTYSCIKEKGIHALLYKLQADLRKDKVGTTYCLKIDIRKFYPSINHDILKSILRRKLKDLLLLKLLDEIIDSVDGVPIGNYLSLFFANLYLAYFDHWVKEELKVKYYYRYADDIVLLSDNKDLLRSWFLAMKIYLTNILKLHVKDNYQIYPVESRGIDFVGYVCFHNYTLLRKSIKEKLLKLVDAYVNRKLDMITFKMRMASYIGWLKYCNSKNLLKKILQKTNFTYSGWQGIKTNISKFKDKWIYIVNIEPRKKYYIIHFMYGGQSYEFRSLNRKLFFYLRTIPKYPTQIKIEQCLQQQKLNLPIDPKNLNL